LSSTGGFIDAATLAVTGTYTVLVNPTGTNTGGTMLTLYDVLADVTGTIVPGGSSLTVSLTTAAQNARLTFSGTNGQRISLRATNSTISSGVLRLLKPDGTALASTVLTTSGGFVDVQSLATTGTYTVLVDPDNTNIGNATLTLYDVPANVAGTLIIGGTAVAASLATPGQNASFTFSGTASQQVTVRVSGNTFGTILLKLVKPDGSQLTAMTSGASSFNLSTQTLPTSGTYTVVVDPSGANIGTLNLSITSP
jgi:hypothetical protein